MARQDLCCVVAAADVAAAAAAAVVAAADVHLATIVFAEHSELHLLVVVVVALMPMTTNPNPIAVAVVLLLLLMLPLPARRLSAASGPPAREKKKKTCSVAVVERDNATHSALYRSIERERDVYVCTKKSPLRQFWVFRGRLGMMMRKPIKINRSSFLTVFLDIKLYNTRKKNKKNRVWFVFSAFV